MEAKRSRAAPGSAGGVRRRCRCASRWSEEGDCAFAPAGRRGEAMYRTSHLGMRASAAARPWMLRSDVYKTQHWWFRKIFAGAIPALSTVPAHGPARNGNLGLPMGSLQTTTFMCGPWIEFPRGPRFARAPAGRAHDPGGHSQAIPNSHTPRQIFFVGYNPPRRSARHLNGSSSVDRSPRPSGGILRTHLGSPQRFPEREERTPPNRP